jgi:prepilin-type N-terminal cleavage/methylation domain-containing protein
MNRRGFTLVELLMAVVILVIIATTYAKFASTYSRAMTDASVRMVAVGAATGRLELIRADPRYTGLIGLYGASSAGVDTTGFPGYPKMRRRTLIVRDSSGTPKRDMTTVTIHVTDPGLRDTVAVTAVIARP